MGLPALTEAYLLDLDGFAKRFLRALFARLPQGVLLALDNYHDVRADSAAPVPDQPEESYLAGLDDIEKVRYADINDVTDADINVYAGVGNKA